MITRIQGLPDHAVGFEAKGKVTMEDYEAILLPAVDELAKRTGEIYYLFVVDTDLSNFTAGAWWDDIKLGLQHFTQWKKIAVVSNSKGIEKFSDMFSFAVPGQVKGFMMDEMEAARQWISEK